MGFFLIVENELRLEIQSFPKPVHAEFRNTLRCLLLQRQYS